MRLRKWLLEGDANALVILTRAAMKRTNVLANTKLGVRCATIARTFSTTSLLLAACPPLLKMPVILGMETIAKSATVTGIQMDARLIQWHTLQCAPVTTAPLETTAKHVQEDFTEKQGKQSLNHACHAFATAKELSHIMVRSCHVSR